MDKEILCIVNNGNLNYYYIIYTDKTFRYTSWSADDYSEWKLIHNITTDTFSFHYRNSGNVNWYCDDADNNDLRSEEDVKLVDAILLAQAIEDILT